MPSLLLASVTSDKALYREGRDDVRLLVLDPLAAGEEVVLDLKHQGVDAGKRPARLDARGVAAITLRDLPAGDHEVRLRGAPESAPACAFTVAAYRLAPLVASMIDRRLEGVRLAFAVRVESFGQPVEGAVKIELFDRNRRAGELMAEARGGRVEGSFVLQGEGPHSLNLQLVTDPSRTATVPIVGSRAAERERTTFSNLGVAVEGSLLPAEGSFAVRGVHLTEGAIRNTPIRLERVDCTRARLTATAAIETMRVVVIDPTFPGKRPGAVDVATCPHPASTDVNYRRGEELFHAGRFAEARAVFEEVLATAPYALHPNYAYYVACCFAREGDKARAMRSLHAAIRDGWTDFELLTRDDDLASLRGYGPYEAIKAGGGQRETVFDDVPAGKTFELEVPSPMAILSIGVFVNDAPWEGWAATITPPALSPALVLPERAAPGEFVQVAVDTGAADDAVSVYLVVKDARLLTADTPESRLAGGLKALAAIAGNELGRGTPSLTLAEALPPAAPPPPAQYDPRSSPIGGRPPPPYNPPPRGAPPPFGPPPPGAFGPPPPAPAFGPPAGFGPPGAFGPPPPQAGFGPLPSPAPAFGAPPPVVAMAMPMPAAPGAPPAVDRLVMASPQPAPVMHAPPAPGGPGPYRQAPPVTPSPVIEEPEVLFAGMVETRGGKGAISIRLGPDVADYLVSAFVIQGSDWAPIEGRFHAERALFATFDLPAFVHPDDGAVGKLYLASPGGAKVRVSRDGTEIPLLFQGRPLGRGESIPAGRAELVFVAGPGRFVATVEDVSGAVEHATRDVEIPGRLRRTARALRLLQPGEQIARGDDPAIVGLRVLPGLDAPFEALVDATADYGHACCEQTAAKLLSACAMYALSVERSRRDRAEAIMIAGIKREASMWLRGKGFKMYPESAAKRDDYWGPKAARYLWNLALLKDLRGEAAPGRALAGAIDEGLAMAADATSAYGLEWPPRRLSTCEDAYGVIRFGKGGAHAVALVEERTAELSGRRGALGAVLERAELAYGAAALLRAGGGASLAHALALANAVITQIGPEGRLYSTVDSVAAIALMTELQAAGITGGKGRAVIDGKPLSRAEALAYPGEIQSIRAEDGVVAVEVSRLVEEDFAAFHAGVPISIRLLRNGATTRRLNALDAVDLEVKLDAGYKPGDLLWVCLPDALSRVQGGGQVKRFSLDFQGNDTLRVPLAATGVTVDRDGRPAPAHFAACVRNMFEEERGGNPGLLDVSVAAPQGTGGGLDRLIALLKGAAGP
ncbi:MAG: hypothetical protein U0359_29015 [Byssovorax sp.]